MINILSNVRTEEDFLKSIKGSYKDPSVSITINGERLNDILL